MWEVAGGVNVGRWDQFRFTVDAYLLSSPELN
jgi:hypothetical protein